MRPLSAERLAEHDEEAMRVSREALVRVGRQAYSVPPRLQLETLLKKLDAFEAIILDDLGYVQQSRQEMEVLFTFFAERYERRSLLISSNLVFSQWEKIFQDPMTTWRRSTGWSITRSS